MKNSKYRVFAELLRREDLADNSGGVRASAFMGMAGLSNKSPGVPVGVLIRAKAAESYPSWHVAMGVGFSCFFPTLKEVQAFCERCGLVAVARENPNIDSEDEMRAMVDEIARNLGSGHNPQLMPLPKQSAITTHKPRNTTKMEVSAMTQKIFGVEVTGYKVHAHLDSINNSSPQPDGALLMAINADRPLWRVISKSGYDSAFATLGDAQVFMKKNRYKIVAPA